MSERKERRVKKEGGGEKEGERRGEGGEDIGEKKEERRKRREEREERIPPIPLTRFKQLNTNRLTRRLGNTSFVACASFVVLRTAS